MNKVPRWVFRYVGNKTFDFSSKKKDFLPENDLIWPKTGIFSQFGPGHSGLFSALLVGRLVVVWVGCVPLVGGLVGWLASLLDDGCLVAGWLAGWLAGWFIMMVLGDHLGVS